jgi:hypothetical protein
MNKQTEVHLDIPGMCTECRRGESASFQLREEEAGNAGGQQEHGGFKMCSFRLLETHLVFLEFSLKFLSDFQVCVYAQFMTLI